MHASNDHTYKHLHMITGATCRIYHICLHMVVKNATKVGNQSCRNSLEKNTIGPTAVKAAVMLMKHVLTLTETNRRTFLNLTNAFEPLGPPAERITSTGIFHISLRPAILVSKPPLACFWCLFLKQFANKRRTRRRTGGTKRQKSPPRCFPAPSEATEEKMSNVNT